MLVTVFFGAWQRRTNPRLIAGYRESAQQALRRGRLQEAKLWCRKLQEFQLRLQMADVFALALVAEAQGELDDARRLMTSLAPDTGRSGFGWANLWLARDLARNKEKLDPAEASEIVAPSAADHAELAGQHRSPRNAGKAVGDSGRC